jgi:hypothetical protein
VERVEHKVSPSQISAMRQCPRRWYYQSIMGIRAPDTPSTLYGSAMHNLIEQRILTGRWPVIAAEQLGPLTSARVAFETMQEFLRPTSKDLEQAVVEADWEIEACGELPLTSRGRIDLRIKGVLLDWKSTGGLRYVKSLQERLQDPQVILYTEACLRAGLVTLPTPFFHVYATRGAKPQGLAVRTEVTSDVLSEGLAGVGSTMGEMRDIITGCANDSEVPRNTNACDDFGGCPHRSRCFANREVVVSDFANKLAERRKALGLNPPPVKDSAEPAQAQFGAAKSTSVLAAPLVAAEQPVAVAPPATSKPKEYAGDLLLVGCLPLRGNDVVLFSDWIAPVVRAAQANLGVSYWALLDYGKGKAEIAARVAEAAERGDVPAVLFVDRRDALADSCVEILIRHYRAVIQKVA